MRIKLSRCSVQSTKHEPKHYVQVTLGGLEYMTFMKYDYKHGVLGFIMLNFLQQSRIHYMTTSHPPLYVTGFIYKEHFQQKTKTIVNAD
jgi:hypothetical protein